MSKPEYVIDGELFETDAEPPGGRERGPDIGGGEEQLPEEPTVDEFLRAVFDLGDCDLRTYEALRRSEAATTGELADRLDRDRSNVSRSLGRLLDAGFVTRQRRILETGGQVYQYTAKPPEAVLRLVETGVERWAGAGYARLSSRLGDERPPD